MSKSESAFERKPCLLPVISVIITMVTIRDIIIIIMFDYLPHPSISKESFLTLMLFISR